MRGFLLDTNVLSEIRRAQCAAGVAAFAKTQPVDLLFTTEINIAEIRFGRNRAPTVERRNEIDAWLTSVVRPGFAERILPVSEDTFVIWRETVEHGRSRNYTHPEPDTLIASVAKQHDLIMVTRDIRPFAEAGVPVLDPWTARFLRADGKASTGVPLDSAALLQFLITA